MKMVKETNKKIYVKDFNSELLTTTIIDKATQLRHSKDELMMMEPYHLKRRLVLQDYKEMKGQKPIIEKSV